MPMTMKLTEKEFWVLFAHGRVLSRELFPRKLYPKGGWAFDCPCHGSYWLLRDDSGWEAMWHDQLAFYADETSLRNILYLEGTG